MRRTAVVKFGLFLALGGVFGTGCGSSDGGSGTGGRAGTGGKPATGGSTGSGGGTATGGSTGSGGGTGTGGSTGSGGAAGSATGGAAGAVHTGGTAGTSSGGAGGSVGGAGHAGAGGGLGGAGGGLGGAGQAGAGGAGGSAGHAGAGGAAGGSAGGAGGATGGAVGGAGGANPVVARGEYLVKSVLGCVGCHTPSGGASLSGSDCFVNSGGSCLSSANLTNDASGLLNLTDQQIKDAFMLGKDPRSPGKYLFSNMPYYQFANLSSADASAIVAFLRSVPGVPHQVAANTAPYDVRPTAAQNAPVDPTYLPAATGANATNGKYLATLACVTCHTVDVANSAPKIIDGAKAFQGGKIVNATVNGTARMVQTSNLTPHSTGIAGWTAAQIATAITTAKDRSGTTICGMRSLPNMAAGDATDIGTYLLSIPQAINAITMTCQ